MKNRIIKNVAGTLTDLSGSLNNYYSATSNVGIETTDYIYIGQRFPFNSFYSKSGVVNEEAAALSIDLWDGNEWIGAAEVIDETDAFSASGYITFTPKKNEQWVADDTQDTNAKEIITGLGDLIIYDNYWCRISTSVNLTAGTTLQWVGNLFSNDDDLGSEYTELLNSNLMAAIESGKTGYEEQHVKAASILISDLVSRKVIDNSAQILERDILIDMAVTKCAELIFRLLGDDYTDDRESTRKEYESRIKRDIYLVDANNNARLDKQETTHRQGTLSR